MRLVDAIFILVELATSVSPSTMFVIGKEHVQPISFDEIVQPRCSCVDGSTFPIAKVWIITPLHPTHISKRTKNAWYGDRGRSNGWGGPSNAKHNWDGLPRSCNWHKIWTRKRMLKQPAHQQMGPSFSTWVVNNTRKRNCNSHRRRKEHIANGCEQKKRPHVLQNYSNLQFGEEIELQLDVLLNASHFQNHTKMKFHSVIHLWVLRSRCCGTICGPLCQISSLFFEMCLFNPCFLIVRFFNIWIVTNDLHQPLTQWCLLLSVPWRKCICL